MVQDLSLTAARLEDIHAHTTLDNSLQVWCGVIQNGWPQDKSDAPVEAIPYFNVQDELSIQNSIILHGEIAVIPQILQYNMLKQIHAPLYRHRWLSATGKRMYVNWPAMSKEVKDFLQHSEFFRSFDNQQQKETLIRWCLVPVHRLKWGPINYFSGFWEID